ncbi:hypothetical protein N9N03_02220 [Chlamydiia bacterium]|nr:hypothetical protein [Chlamydiia bacterium]
MTIKASSQYNYKVPYLPELYNTINSDTTTRIATKIILTSTAIFALSCLSLTPTITLFASCALGTTVGYIALKTFAMCCTCVISFVSSQEQMMKVAQENKKAFKLPHINSNKRKVPVIHYQKKHSNNYMVCFHGNAAHVSQMICNDHLLETGFQKPFCDHYIASSPPEPNFFDIITGKFNEQTIIDSCVATLRYMGDFHRQKQDEPTPLNLTLVGQSMGGAVALAGLRKLSIQQPDLVKSWNVTVICDRTFKRYSNLAPDILKITDFFSVIKSLLKHLVRFVGVDYDNEDIVNQFNNLSNKPFASLSIQSYTTKFEKDGNTFHDTVITEKHCLKTKKNKYSLENRISNPRNCDYYFRKYSREVFGTCLHNMDGCYVLRYLGAEEKQKVKKQ